MSEVSLQAQMKVQLLQTRYNRNGRSSVVYWQTVTAQHWSCAGNCSMEKSAGPVSGMNYWSGLRKRGRNGTAAYGTCTTRWKR